MAKKLLIIDEPESIAATAEFLETKNLDERDNLYYIKHIMPKENSAVELLLDRINDLMRRVELLEEIVPTYFTNTTHAPYGFVPETNIPQPQDEIVHIPTVRATATDIYGPSIVERYERRLDNLERELHERMEEAQHLNFEMGDDGQIYITPRGDEGVNP